MKKMNVFLALIVVGALLFFVGRTAARNSESLNQQTRDNLSTAMHGEAFAYAKYLLYARQARQHGDVELARLFTKAANMERFQHFAEEAELAGLVGSDEENLKDAIKGESYEVETMYLQFAQQAAAAGDKAAADRFEEVRHDEMGHRDAFKAALSKMEHHAATGR